MPINCACPKNVQLFFFRGGKTFFYSNEPGSNTLYDAFAATMERGDVIDADKRVQVVKHFV